MASNFTARQVDIYTIVCTSPSVNLTPIGSAIVPIPYNVSETLEKSADVSETVSMGKAKVYLKKSHSSCVVGDGPGVCCGVSSGTLLAKSYVIEHSSTTKVDGSEIIRVGDEQYMQGGNTKGKVTGSEGGSPSCIKDDGEIDGSTIPEDLDIQSIITALTPISFSTVMNMSNKTNPMASNASGTLGSSTGSPVILNTAQFIYTNKDIKLLNGKSPLLLEQTYVSKQDYKGMFGLNTRYAYESQFKRIEDNIYRLFLIDAKKFDFELQEDNTFKNIGNYPCSIEYCDANTFNITYFNTNEIHTYKNDKLIKIQESNDNCINILYEDNLLKKVSNNYGAFFDFAYEQNKVFRVKDNNNRVWIYKYDKSDNLIQIINPASNKKTFTYDEKNNLTNIQDENENDIVSVVYDEDNRVHSYTKEELTNTYTYISSKMISKEDNLGNITNYGLDDCGQIRAVLAKNNNSESYVYDEVNNKAIITDINNSSKTKYFDDKSRVVKIVYEDNSETLYTYEDSHNNPLSILESNGNITTYSYDKKVNLLEHVKNNGDTIVYEYDDKSNLVKSVDIQGCETTYEYNELSCMIKTENALGIKTFYTYDKLNRNICIINAKDKKEFLEYDVLNNNTKYINALEDTILFTYDKTNKLTSITDTKNNKTQYVYDKHNRIVKVINAKGDEKVYTYNVNNTVSSLTQEDGQTSTYKYNIDEQLIEVNNSDDTITYSYNNLGQLLQANNSTAKIENYYNKNSQLITHSINDIDIDKVYDNETNALNMVLFKDKQYSFKRDDNNNIQEIINKKHIIQLSKNNYNITTNITYPNEQTQEKTYNVLYNMSNVKTNNLELTYSYDELGLVILKEHTQNNKTSKKVFFYDDINRLIKSDITNFTYDEAGNKLNNNEQYSNTHELEEDDTFYYVYDKRGNIKEKVNKSTNDSISYTFNASNLLTSVSSTDNNLEFTYDALQRRISKKHNGILHNYLYDNYNIIAILDENKELIASIIHDENIDSPLSITTYKKSQLSKDEYNSLSEEKQVEHDNTLENTYFYHSDNQGSIIALSNIDAKIVESFIYDDAYGIILDHQKTIETLNPYGYTAQVYDTNELYYYKARYYDPTTQRFLSPDPIEFKGGDYNFYRYVNNSPLNFTDPSGLNAFSLSSMSDFFSSLLPSYIKTVDNPIAFAADSLTVSKTPNADIDKIDAKSSSTSGSDGGKVVGEGVPAVEAKLPGLEEVITIETDLYMNDNNEELRIPYLDSTRVFKFKSSKPFIAGMRAMFGGDVSHNAVKLLMLDLEAGIFEYPKWESQKNLGETTAGYHYKGTIYLNEKLILDAENDPKKEWLLFRVMIEETGHYIDYMLRNHYLTIGGDAKGDEGTVFAADFIRYNKLLTKDFEFAKFIIKDENGASREFTAKVLKSNPNADDKAKDLLFMEDADDDHGIVTLKDGSQIKVEFFKIRGGGAIHEDITEKAAAEVKILYDNRLDEGAAWPDVPCKDTNSIETCYAGTWWNEHTEGTMAYRSHHGDRQFWHSMAHSEEVTNQVVVNEIVKQAKIWFKDAVTTKYDFKGNILEKGSIRGYGPGDDGLFHIGKILHMVQDSYSLSHLKRENEIGEIIQFYSYNNQDAKKHGDPDKDDKSKGAKEALNASIKVLTLYKKIVVGKSEIPDWDFPTPETYFPLVEELFKNDLYKINKENAKNMAGGHGGYSLTVDEIRAKAMEKESRHR